MSKKDYVAIAAIVREKLSHAENADIFEGIARLADSLSDYFAETNDNFDRERFVRACGLEGF